MSPGAHRPHLSPRPVTPPRYGVAVNVLDVDENRGKWVALHPTSGRVVASHVDLWELHLIIDQRHIAGALVQRVPAEDEPLTIGLG
jgi:hypothetical protein